MLSNLRSSVSMLKEASTNYLAKKSLYYVVEQADWVIKEVGKSITSRIDSIPSRITTQPLGIRNSLVHFGSINTYIDASGPRKMHPSNRIIVTWFHVIEGDPRLQRAKEMDGLVQAWHTSCNATRAKLIEAGLPEGKIKVIPLGVDLDAFRPMPPDYRKRFRAQLGIPDDGIVIGSFQKDGNGWGEGTEPKLIKGPDLFCDAIEGLAKRLKVTVLLTGPARGYVKNRLAAAGIPFLHRYLGNPRDVAPFYQALDYYIVASRDEGGPMQILESMASGVPIVSTAVGMAPDVIEDGVNGFLVPADRTNAIPDIILGIIRDDQGREKLIEKGRKTASAFGWDSIGEMYFDRLYKGLL